MHPASIGILVLTGSLWLGPAGAVDGLALEAGSGTGSAQRVGVRLTWDWSRRWFDEGRWALGGYWELGASHWDAEPGFTGIDSLVEAGGGAVLRYARSEPWAGGLAPYVELGLGLHLMSESGIENRDLGIEFTFAEHVGLGLRFGPARRWDIGYRFQHLSNGGLGDSNDGINYSVLRVAYAFP